VIDELGPAEQALDQPLPPVGPFVGQKGLTSAGVGNAIVSR